MKNFFQTRLLYIGIALIAMGAAFIIPGYRDHTAHAMDPISIEYLTPDMLTGKSLLVEGDIIGNYGAYMEEYTTNYGVKTGNSTYYYLIDLGDYGYIGLRTQAASQFDNQSDAYYDYLMGLSATPPESIHVKGILKKQTKQEYNYMLEYLQEMGYSVRESEQYGYQYVIYPDSEVDLAILYPFGIGSVIIGIVMIAIYIILKVKEKENAKSFSYNATGVSTGEPSNPTFTPYEPSTFASTPEDPQISSNSHDDGYNDRNTGNPYSSDSTATDSDAAESDSSTSSTSKFSLKLDE